MNGGLNRLLAAAVVAGVALIGAPAALACSGGPSAYNVYHECLSNGGSGGGGSKHKGGGGPGGSGNSNPTAGAGGGHTGSSTPAPSSVPKPAQKAISHAGKDQGTLQKLYAEGGQGRFLAAHNAATAASEPTAIGSAFDLGSGPTALLIALAGTAVLLLAFTGAREVRQRRR